MFCKNLEFCDYFAFPKGKVEFANVGLNIDCEKNDKENLNLRINAMESIDVLCDEDECVTPFKA